MGRRTAGRRLAVVAMAAAVTWLCPAAVGAAGHDGRYAGLITCDLLPGQTTQPLKTEILIAIKGDQAEYQREVLQPTSTARLGVTERGTGTVSPTGEVTLTGGAGAQTWSYQATYQGRFEGKALRLAGTQLWQLPSRGPHTRRCTIAVSAAE